MRIRNSLVLTAALTFLSSGSLFGESAGTARQLASLFGAGAAAPRQSATVPVSVQHGATFAEFGAELAYAPNTFGTIFGPVDATSGASQTVGSGSLVNRTMDWSQSFANGAAPTSLDGVQVRVNGKDAFISFIGLGEDFERDFDQINFISPDDDAMGPVTVEVFKEGEMVGSSIVNLGAVSPALFAFSPVDGEGNTFYAAAQADFSAFVAPENLFGGPVNGVPVRPAAPGDVISIFGTGFGQTDPGVPAGTQLGAAELAPLAQAPTVRVGGMTAEVFYAGLAPGLTGVYQFNIRVPNVMDGNHRIEIDVEGVATPLNAFLPVQTTQ